MKKLLTFFTLFGSLSTLLCCALPALLVALGLGGALASLVGTFPQIIWVSTHKGIVFGIAGSLLAFGGALHWRARNEPCPTDPELASACRSARTATVWVYGLSVMIYAVGAYFAFLAPIMQ